MNINTEHVVRMVRSVVRGAKPYGEHNLLHPARDWFIGVGIFIVLCICGAVLAASTYITFQNVTAHQAGEVVGEQVYRAGLVTEALGILDAKAKTYESLYSTLVESRPTIEEVVPVNEEVVATSSAETVVEANGVEVSGVSDESLNVESVGGEVGVVDVLSE